MNALNAIDERELLLKLRDGDKNAFERLYFEHSPAITAHLIHLLKSVELAGELAQDTFMSVWEHRDRIDPDKSFKAYLYKIATNKTYNLFRKAYHDHKLRTYMLPILEEGYNNVESYIYNKDNQALLNDLLAKMPEKQREVFTLFKIEGYSYNEISARLGISHSTINTHINRANKYLKSRILGNPEYFAVFLFAAFGCLPFTTH